MVSSVLYSCLLGIVFSRLIILIPKVQPACFAWFAGSKTFQISCQFLQIRKLSGKVSSISLKNQSTSPPRSGRAAAAPSGWACHRPHPSLWRPHHHRLSVISYEDLHYVLSHKRLLSLMCLSCLTPVSIRVHVLIRVNMKRLVTIPRSTGHNPHKTRPTKTKGQDVGDRTHLTEAP